MRRANLEGLWVGFLLVEKFVGAVHVGVVHVVGEIGAGGWMCLWVILVGEVYGDKVFVSVSPL